MTASFVVARLPRSCFHNSFPDWPECLVLDQRSARRCAKLVLRKRRRSVLGAARDLRRLEKILIRIEDLVAQVFVGFAVDPVGTGLRAQVNHATGELAPFRS